MTYLEIFILMCSASLIQALNSLNETIVHVLILGYVYAPPQTTDSPCSWSSSCFVQFTHICILSQLLLIRKPLDQKKLIFKMHCVKKFKFVGNRKPDGRITKKLLQTKKFEQRNCSVLTNTHDKIRSRFYLLQSIIENDQNKNQIEYKSNNNNLGNKE